MRPNRRLRTPITNWRRYRRRSLTARMTGRRKEKKDTKDLIKRVKDYLTDEMVAPEDMERLAKGVLAIQLPGSLDDILSMIQNIRGMLANFTEFKEDLKKLEDQAKTAQDLLENALDIRRLEKAKESNDMAHEMIQEIEKKRNNTETNFNSSRPPEMLEEIEALKKKTEMNREQAEQAKADVITALGSATNTKEDLEKVIALFDKLKEGNTNQDSNEVVIEHLKNITMEAEKITKYLQDKIQQIWLSKTSTTTKRTKPWRLPCCWRWWNPSEGRLPPVWMGTLTVPPNTLGGSREEDSGFYLQDGIQGHRLLALIIMLTLHIHKHVIADAISSTNNFL
ncbi:laminin subunit beta-4-like isoform X2 [Salmo salar]|uniref:Laminin subunit beta-4-like isoform X2 n=1 Tax=Salmo salar TaxID=8030 RepID=A0ABM3CCS7_SALSA|nr:laminin subunit beta-4-like isoform X2 [Salmo salar]XP_045544375.1 laminin subunit beta-4-like isoform X2 [Salmo salar]